jgi:P27 family predicted phage terminase small subunit
MLADQMQTYVSARAQQEKHPLVIKINDGKTFAPNPFISVANTAMKNCISLMNELGLTPKSRLQQSKPEEHSSVAKFLRGPKG